ncbi:MAG: peptidylprolyl isomerase, partial [Candidatus Omnitrophica bacterium]|nr:peptidylprolyl isomerase [Candidatus Omnitrophota bacterium]
ILSGEDFGKIAQEISDDSNAEKGGLTGWIERGDMIPDIDREIFKMRPGEISDIIETPLGYHLFRIEEREEGHDRTFEDVKEEIYSILFGIKSRERFGEWLEELKQNAFISIR